MDCSNPKNKLEVMALNIALGNHLSSSHEESDFAKVYDALKNNDEDAVEALEIIVWELFENVDLPKVAETIDSMANIMILDLVWAYEEGMKDASASKTTRSEYVNNLLTIAGIEIYAVFDQPGMYCWIVAENSFDSCEEAIFDSREEAISDALREVVGSTMAYHDLSDEFWESLSDTQKTELVREAHRPERTTCIACGTKVQVFMSHEDVSAFPGAVISEARITSMPKTILDPMPEVWVTIEGVEKMLFSFYPDEINFTASEFVGISIAEAYALRHQKDVAYLRS